MSGTRKIAAIFWSPISSGYSRLTGTGRGPHAVAAAGLRSDLGLIPPSGAHHGRVVRSAPATAASSEFRSVVLDAVGCAIRSAEPASSERNRGSSAQTGGSSFASVFTSATLSGRRATAISWATASISLPGSREAFCAPGTRSVCPEDAYHGK